MQYEFNLSCAAQYEFDLSAAPRIAAQHNAAQHGTQSSYPPVEPTPAAPAPSRAG